MLIDSLRTGLLIKEHIFFANILISRFLRIKGLQAESRLYPTAVVNNIISTEFKMAVQIQKWLQYLKWILSFLLYFIYKINAFEHNLDKT